MIPEKFLASVLILKMFRFMSRSVMPFHIYPPTSHIVHYLRAQRQAHKTA